MPWQSLGLGRLHTAEKCTPASVRQETLTVSANCKSTAPLCMSGPSKVVFPFLPSKSKNCYFTYRQCMDALKVCIFMF